MKDAEIGRLLPYRPQSQRRCPRQPILPDDRTTKSSSFVIVTAPKKLARLMVNILLAFCWVHVRRDFLDAGRGAFTELEVWVLEWKERIGTLYHLNKQRLEHWDCERSLTEQSEAFKQQHEALKEALQHRHKDATSVVDPDADGAQTDDEAESKDNALSKSAQTQQQKVLTSLLNHWAGLTIFVDNPQVPMDNNPGEQSIRHPVTGRKNYYGLGSRWSAQLAATLFSILQTLGGLTVEHQSTLLADAVSQCLC